MSQEGLQWIHIDIFSSHQPFKRLMKTDKQDLCFVSLLHRLVSTVCDAVAKVNLWHFISQTLFVYKS